MGRIVWRKANRHAITRNDANPESAHAAGQLSRHLLAVFESNLIAAAAENFVDATGRLNQVVSRQREKSFPSFSLGFAPTRPPTGGDSSDRNHPPPSKVRAG